MTSRNKLKIGLITLAILLGTVIFIGSIWGIDNAENIIISVITSKAPIKDGSLSFKQWRNSSVDIFFSVHLFNLTNVDQVLNDGARPNYQEIGPYVYLQKREKVDYEFLENGEDLQYTERRLYTFVPDLSVGDPNTDIVHTVDLVFLTAIQQKMDYIKQGLVYYSMSSRSPFIAKTVNQYVWGYYDPVLDAQSKGRLAGLFTDINNTISTKTVINTGLGDINLFGKIVEVDGKRDLDTWTSFYANQINGSDGSMFPPGVKKDLPLYVFAKDVCRSFKLVFSKEVQAKNDNRITLYEFVGDQSQSLNATMNPDNKGFCVANPIGPSCPLAGMMDLSKCKAKGDTRLPLYASQPRFNKADPRVTANLDGLIKPTKEDQTKLYIHPLTGYPLQAYKRLQINFYFKPVEYFSELTKKLNDEYYLPLVWIQESAEAGPETLNMIYEKVNGGQKKITTILYIALAFGLLMVFIGFALALVFAFKKPSKSKLFAESTNSTPLSNRSSDFPNPRFKPAPKHDMKKKEKLYFLPYVPTPQNL